MANGKQFKSKQAAYRGCMPADDGTEPDAVVRDRPNEVKSRKTGSRPANKAAAKHIAGDGIDSGTPAI